MYLSPKINFKHLYTWKYNFIKKKIKIPLPPTPWPAPLGGYIPLTFENIILFKPSNPILIFNINFNPIYKILLLLKQSLRRLNMEIDQTR